MGFTIREAMEWLLENRGICIKRAYLHELCLSNRLKSQLIGRMRFIDTDDLEKFEFKKPGRPKNEK